MNTFYLQHRAVARVWAVLTMFAVLLSAFSAPLSVAFAQEADLADPVVVDVTTTTDEVDEEEQKKTNEPALTETTEASLFRFSVQGGDKVTICHATDSDTNPFTKNNVDVSSLVQGHGDDDGDIIPVTMPDYPNGQNLGTTYPAYGEMTGAQILDQDCPKPPKPKKEVKLSITKIVCEDETLLPNDGYTEITADTADDFLEENTDCYPGEDWQFQYAMGGQSNQSSPDNDGELGAPWENTNYTNGNGNVVVTLSEDDVDGQSTISVREVWNDDYIAFTGQNGGNVSAEIYCSNDAANFDNLEWISGVKVENTYHCVAWNVPVLEEIEMCKYDALEAPIEGWEMTLTNGDITYTLETEDDGCVSQMVNPNIGPWTVDEEMQKDWEQVDVSAENGYVNSEDDVNERCVFFGREVVDAITTYVQIPDTDDKRCVFTNEYVPPCEDMPNGDWAGSVVESDQKLKKNGSAITDPNRTDDEEVLGASDWVNNGSTGFFALGFGGSVTVEFDTYVPNVLGNDIAVHEATNGTYPAETATVEVSQDGIDWESVGVASNTNAGKISYFDFDSTGYAWIKFVRVIDTSNPALHANDADGFDVDAIAATKSVCEAPEEPKICSVTIVSDTTDTVDGAAAKLVTFIHDAWDAVVNVPSKWIWGDNPVADPVNETNQTFLKKFGWNGPVTSAILTIAADNSYEVAVNGDVAGVDATEFNYVAANTHDLTSFIDQGNNELEVAVKNWAQANGTTKSNPAGLKYELVITGTDAECDIPYEEPKFSTVTMCKFNGNEQALSGWNLMLLGDVVETVEVSATNGTGATVALNTGAYVAVASGTWDNNRGPLNIVDAEYSTEDNWVTQMDGFTGYGTDILELQLNGITDPNSNWGDYNSGHEYARGFNQTATGSATFAIYDTFYGDNTGSLDVTVYEGYASTTNQNGCVTFTNVPYGTYDVDEIMKDGWQNVSGLGAVTVDSETESFTVVNRPVTIPTEPVATVIAHKIVCTDEADLPNWGAVDANTISSTTAAQWVLDHDSCEFESGWQFEWAGQSASNPDNNLPTTAFYGVAGGDWTLLPSTDVNGKTQVQLTAAQIAGMSNIWMREVLKSGYIPFTYGPTNMSNANNVTAEMYCHTDAFNYDNYDRVDGISVNNTYNCVAWNHAIEPAPICVPETNLLTNSDFESPEVENGAQWDIFSSVLGWAIAWMNPTDAPAAASLELHEGVNGWTSASGNQHTELDSDWQGPAGTSGEDASVAISQTVPTIAGKKYTLSWNFSPRPGTAANQNVLEVLVNNDLKKTNTAAGGAITVWTPDNYVFTGTGAPMTVTFQDAGLGNSEGTLLDNVSLNCSEPDNGGGNDNTYRLEGSVWHDDNENSFWEKEGEVTEVPLEGWTVRATKGETTLSTTTDAFGFYYFEVPAGTWTVYQIVPEGWDQITSPEEYVVTVPDDLFTQTLVEKVFAYLVPVAHAAVMGTIDDLDFGNNESDVITTPNNPSSSRSGGGGRRATPTVAGDSISAPGLMPLVLGEQVTAVPYGAPGTGHGGSAATSGLTLLQLLFVQRRKDVA